MRARTIRLFVSSTFADMKAERDVLQREVFPHLTKLCASRGFSFQPIDLRWGVSEEASNDNATMRICLRELRRCLSAGTMPNFLILLGDRYGWCPLPEVIPAAVFASLLPFVPAHLRQMIEEQENFGSPQKVWYRRDDNAIPPIYELQPRGAFSSFEELVEGPLVAALRNAAAQAGLRDTATNLAIGVSATEQEITEGALAVTNAREHVHAFFRTAPAELESAAMIAPPADGTRSPALPSSTRLDALKARLLSHLGEANVHSYSASNQGSSTAEDLARFAIGARAVLESIILKQLAALALDSVGNTEDAVHREFMENQGCQPPLREDELRNIEAHTESREPKLLAVAGCAGMGKSALLAQAAYRSQLKYERGSVWARFIGISPDSTQLTTLLRDLVGWLRKRYPEDSSDSATGTGLAIPFDILELIKAFHEALRRPDMENPVYLFLDGLDRLSVADGSQSLFWLPLVLNPAVRLVVSIEDSEEGVESHRVSPIQILMARQERASILRLNPLTRKDGEMLLKLSIDRDRRCLQPSQQSVILDAFEQHGNPLWMTIAAAQASRLRSWDPPQHFDASLPGLIRQVLANLADDRHHGRTLVEHVGRYLGCARDGMTEQELVELLSNSQEVMSDFRHRHPRSPPVESLPASVWTALLGDLEGFLTERQIDGVAIMLFQHRHFVSALDGVASFSAATCHRDLAAFFKRQFDLHGVQAIRALRELPHQQRRSGMWAELFATLTSPILLEGRMTPHSKPDASPAGRLYSLLDEFEIAAKEMP
jgi:hypothetical protein